MDRRFLMSFVRLVVLSFTSHIPHFRRPLQIKHVRETLGRPDLFSVAEYWSAESVDFSISERDAD